MRTTVDLPPALHEQVRRYAANHRQSISATVAALTARGLGDADRDLDLEINPASGFPAVDLGRAFTQAEVQEWLDEEP
ncbi:MAG: hypothetical protein LBD97_06435 [Bifidobacteriaceae bacterium]|nr:hypothetical protein [Bifidobacteriaceae bacterium]